MRHVVTHRTSLLARLATGLGFGITLVLALLVWASPTGLTRLERTLLDVQLRLRGERPAGQHVSLVLIDEKSLNEVGRWPWPRDRQAQLVDALARGGAKVIGLDIIYAEPESTQSLAALKDLLAAASTAPSIPASFHRSLAQHVASADTDRIFSGSLQRSQRVILAAPFFVADADASRPEEFPLMPQAQSWLRKDEFRLVRRAKSGEELAPYEAAAVLPLSLIHI